jgi:NAD(P)H dehydrogenase (quinone)
MIAVTGASGNLGRLVVEHVLGAGTAPREIVALVRNREKAQDLVARGMDVRPADYSRPESLAPALEGVTRLLLVTGSDVGQRVTQHQNVVDAARRAGVRLLLYTSIVNADTTKMQLAGDHKATEALIRQSGVPFVFLRNSWYAENYTRNLPATLERGVIIGSADAGRVSAAARADYAAAAAAVLTGGGEANRAYELGGDNAFTLGEFAEELSQQSGRRIEYHDLSESAHIDALMAAGLPEPVARLLADSDQGLARGDLYTSSGDLRRLIGRPTIPVRDVIAAALARL